MSQIKVLADLVSGEGPLPGLQMAVFPLCPSMVDKVSFGLFFSYKDTQFLHGSVLL